MFQKSLYFRNYNHKYIVLGYVPIDMGTTEGVFNINNDNIIALEKLR